MGGGFGAGSGHCCCEEGGEGEAEEEAGDGAAGEGFEEVWRSGHVGGKGRWVLMGVVAVVGGLDDVYIEVTGSGWVECRSRTWRSKLSGG